MAPSKIQDVTQWFATAEEARDWLVNDNMIQQYAIVTSRSKGHITHSPFEGQHKTREYTCERGGEARPNPTRRRENTKTMKCGCSWSAIVTFYASRHLEGSPAFGLRYRQFQHDCQPLLEPNMSNAIRNIKQAAWEKDNGVRIIDKVEAFAAEGNLTAGDIMSKLVTTEGILVTLEDVKGYMRTLKTTKYGPYTSTQYFLQLLQRDPTIAAYKVDRKNERIHRIFWIYKKSLEMWSHHAEFLSFDNTYKVNRFNMPLLQISGITALHSNFSVAFALSSQEDEDSFVWSLRCLDEVACNNNVSPPMTIMSDFDKGFKNAAAEVFPDAQQQLCIWHIMKNVFHNITQKWVGPLGSFAGGVCENARIQGTNAGIGSSNGLANTDANDTDDEIDPQVRAFNDRANEVANTYTEPNPPEINLNRVTASLFEASKLLAPASHVLGPIYSLPNTPEGFMDGWKSVAYTYEENDFKARWEALKDHFSHQEGIYIFFFFFCLLSRLQ